MKIFIDEVYYAVESVGEGEPLICLHGFTGDGSTWDDLKDQLSGKLRVITIDCLGHGESDIPSDYHRYSIEKCAHDLNRIVEELHLASVNILGYSMGGRLALTFAVLFPEKVKRLILESSSPGLKSEDERSSRQIADEKLSQILLNDGIEAFVDYWEDIALFSSQKKLPAEKQQKIRDQRLNCNPLGLANSLRGMGTGAQPSWWDSLENLQMPVLLLAGELDEKFCLLNEEMKKRLPNAVFHKISECGHALHVEHSTKFGKMIEEFLLTT
ncbi:2-succinyl-6-hydroxy-2,4-cyclohexadiene-1-carboxylate synthase [Falsibacillus pallidus]|uniref:Putative 2-succinyl-6-hydroxy-2,4-cyclohexadiene-1-carboxylate synthase n=1 Tax=Falsibacillus pallidus TaxID=493781 RepID=A0A370GKX3_9BACI|nr:2-succinyl-6-hydroxy-2,4-cyclohexadiene-1-carboxylate synthase [Falsibacillus pallidus]RDI44375.1 2-succinyl-6-hydroxy-2,4-cyclohexadiene-1-carboxylate synthase [Falsibacillus pallidus]